MFFGKGEARPVWEDAEDKLELELTPSLFVHPLQSSAEGTESPTPTMVKVEVSENVKGSKNTFDNTSTFNNDFISENASTIDNTSTIDNIPTSDNTSD